jgi:putative DNA primase/helicase
MRYGTRGSLSVDVRTGRWYDHERGCGGGVLDLIEDCTGRKGGERIEWLVEQGIEIGSARTAPPPPKKGKPKLGCPL